MEILPHRARSWRMALLAVFVAPLVGCGASGTWNDDPTNWERAFASTKPDAVVVVHSHYWRSAHWTTEFAYYFHLRDDGTLHAQLFGDDVLTELTGDAAREAFNSFFGEKPDWFLSVAPDNYAVHALIEQPYSNFRVFVHRKSGDLFLTDNQF